MHCAELVQTEPNRDCRHLHAAGEDDRFQIDGINRLIRLMQEIAATGKVAGAPSQTAAAPQRQQLPSHIAAARQSVATARTPQQRWAVTSKQQGQPPQRPVTTAAPAAALQSPAQPAVGTARSPLEQVQQAAQMLQWFAQEAAELPAAARWEALRCGAAPHRAWGCNHCSSKQVYAVQHRRACTCSNACSLMCWCKLHSHLGVPLCSTVCLAMSMRALAPL